MINSIRTGHEIQDEINDLEKVKFNLTNCDIDEKYKLLISEIQTIVNVLNWIGSMPNFPKPSRLIKDFVYNKTGVIV